VELADLAHADDANSNLIRHFILSWE